MSQEIRPFSSDDQTSYLTDFENFCLYFWDRGFPDAEENSEDCFSTICKILSIALFPLTALGLLMRSCHAEPLLTHEEEESDPRLDDIRNRLEIDTPEEIDVNQCEFESFVNLIKEANNDQLLAILSRTTDPERKNLIHFLMMLRGILPSDHPIPFNEGNIDDILTHFRVFSFADVILALDYVPANEKNQIWELVLFLYKQDPCMTDELREFIKAMPVNDIDCINYLTAMFVRLSEDLNFHDFAPLCSEIIALFANEGLDFGNNMGLNASNLKYALYHWAENPESPSQAMLDYIKRCQPKMLQECISQLSEKMQITLSGNFAVECHQQNNLSLWGDIFCKPIDIYESSAALLQFGKRDQRKQFIKEAMNTNIPEIRLHLLKQEQLAWLYATDDDYKNIGNLNRSEIANYCRMAISLPGDAIFNLLGVLDELDKLNPILEDQEIQLPLKDLVLNRPDDQVAFYLSNHDFSNFRELGRALIKDDIMPVYDDYLKTLKRIIGKLVLLDHEQQYEVFINLLAGLDKEFFDGDSLDSDYIEKIRERWPSIVDFFTDCDVDSPLFEFLTPERIKDEKGFFFNVMVYKRSDTPKNLNQTLINNILTSRGLLALAILDEEELLNIMRVLFKKELEKEEPSLHEVTMDYLGSFLEFCNDKEKKIFQDTFGNAISKNRDFLSTTIVNSGEETDEVDDLDTVDTETFSRSELKEKLKKFVENESFEKIQEVINETKDDMDNQATLFVLCQNLRTEETFQFHHSRATLIKHEIDNDLKDVDKEGNYLVYSSVCALVYPKEIVQSFENFADFTQWLNYFVTELENYEFDENHFLLEFVKRAMETGDKDLRVDLLINFQEAWESATDDDIDNLLGRKNINYFLDAAYSAFNAEKADRVLDKLEKNGKLPRMISAAEEIYDEEFLTELKKRHQSNLESGELSEEEIV